MSRLICPNCGAEVVLPENSSIVTGITLSKNTDNNTYKLNMEKTTEYGTNNNTTTKENRTMGKINERIEALKNAGVDTTDFFSVSLPTGGEMAMKMENGIPVPVDLDSYFKDEIEEEIFANGYVKNTRLHRRWVMGQMMRALNHKAYLWNGHTYGKDGFDGWLENHGYSYQWKMVLEEIRVLTKLGNDFESYNERSNFFTKEVIEQMITDYLDELKRYIDSLPSQNCKGIPYKRIKGQNIFCEDIDKKIYAPIRRNLFRLGMVNNDKDLYWQLYSFIHYNMVKLPYNTPMSKAFKDTYKGEGAYYTLKNMALFHKVNLKNYQTGEIYTNSTDSFNYLKRMNVEYKGEGWRMFALLKETIERTNFDFEESCRVNS